MLTKIVFVLSCLILTTNAACNLTSQPEELIACVGHVTTFLIGAVTNSWWINYFQIAQNYHSFRSCKNVSNSVIDCKMCARSDHRLYCRQGSNIFTLFEIISSSFLRVVWSSCSSRSYSSIDLLLWGSKPCQLFNSRLIVFSVNVYFIFINILIDSAIQQQRCFAADSLVNLADGTQKTIAQLQSGDNILAFNHQTKQIISTPFLTMLDFQSHHFGNFLHLFYIHSFEFCLT